MDEIYIIRHGQADHLIDGKTGGWSDSSLTAKGRLQATSTGKKLKTLLNNKSYRLYCSDLSRARETAEIIGMFIEYKPMVRSCLRELNNGVAANKTREEAKLLEIPMTQPVLDWTPYPEAESWNMLHVRITRCMEEISKDITDTAVIVTHANTANAILQWWLEFPSAMMEKVSFEIEPCSITHVSITKWSNSKTIHKLNDTGHL